MFIQLALALCVNVCCCRRRYGAALGASRYARTRSPLIEEGVGFVTNRPSTARRHRRHATRDDEPKDWSRSMHAGLAWALVDLNQTHRPANRELVSWQRELAQFALDSLHHGRLSAPMNVREHDSLVPLLALSLELFDELVQRLGARRHNVFALSLSTYYLWAAPKPGTESPVRPPGPPSFSSTAKTSHTGAPFGEINEPRQRRRLSWRAQAPER